MHDRGSRLLTVLVVLAGLFGPPAAAAQPAPAAAEPVQAPISLGHAALKGVTLKLANAVTSMGIFYTGTGSVFASSALSLLIAATSYSVYVTNDYLWDRLSPNTNVAANNQSFQTGTSLGRNTLKFLTFKPAVVTADWTAIYLYTGSWASTLAMGSAWSLLTPVVFYANNTGWDWYDWWSTGAATDELPNTAGTQ